MKTLVLQLSESAGRVIDGIRNGFMAALSAHRIRMIWEGYSKGGGHRPVYFFTFAVPRHIAWLWELHQLCDQVVSLPKDGQGLARLSCRALAKNIRFGLGVPDQDGSPLFRQFMEALAAAPDDLATWHALADWLIEAGRGDKLALALAPTATKKRARPGRNSR